MRIDEPREIKRGNVKWNGVKIGRGERVFIYGMDSSSYPAARLPLLLPLPFLWFSSSFHKTASSSSSSSSSLGPFFPSLFDFVAIKIMGLTVLAQLDLGFA